MTPTELKHQKEVSVLTARIKDLEDVLGLNDDNLGVVFKLPRQATKLLGLLLAVPNVTSEMAQQRLGIVADTKVAVSRLREYMNNYCADHGIAEKFEIQSRRTLGYWLDDNTKSRIQALVTPKVIDEAEAFIEELGEASTTALAS